MRVIKQIFKIDPSLIIFSIRRVGGILRTVCADNFTYDHLDVLSGRGYEEEVTVSLQIYVQLVSVMSTVLYKAWSRCYS